MLVIIGIPSIVEDNISVGLNWIAKRSTDYSKGVEDNQSRATEHDYDKDAH